MANWYYLIGDDQHGPVGEEDIQRMLASGELRPADMLWQAGMPDWLEVSKVFPSYGHEGGAVEENVYASEGASAPWEQAEAGPSPVTGPSGQGGLQPEAGPYHMPTTERNVRAMPGEVPMVQIEPLALGSIILAIASPALCALTSIPAVVLGHMALARIKREPGR